MSVIVKGMKMPLNCAMCERWSICECLKEYKDYESILYAVDDGDLVRADECPLIELPPHGRLIDADELKTAFPRCDNSMDIKVASVRATINHASTIIEAEGSET